MDKDQFIKQSINFKQNRLNKLIKSFKNESNNLNDQNCDIVLRTMKSSLDELIKLQIELEILKSI